MNPNQKPQEDVVGLLPCPNPWCNSQCRDRPEPFVRYYESSCRYRVNCDICPQIGPSGETADEARTAWNTRAAPTYEAGRRDMREAAGWQPIETAPRDCNPILVWTGYSHEVVYECWQDDEGGPVWFNGDVTVDEPTHWMPLPTEPLGGEGKPKP